MKKIGKPWIKLKESIDEVDYEIIAHLQESCVEHDQTALKLELDYKLGVSNDSSKGVEDINEFLYFDGEELIGYMGISSFGGPWEVNGMVDPDYRRKGVFTKLFELVIAEWKRRCTGSMLLLSDRNSESGQNFIASVGAKYKHSEYEMFLKKDIPDATPDQLAGIAFRKATNADAHEIARQNAIYFKDEDEISSEDMILAEKEEISSEDMILPKEEEISSEDMILPKEEEISSEDLILPEEEERRGMTSYLVEKEGQIIGKVNLQLTSKLGAIFGLGVLPEHRRKGYGRALLLLAIEKLREANAQEIMLQVAAENSNALNLYKSCGFEETSTMDYFELR
ncbi:GNAT family N-acetyltransferase [Mesobacillus subterraneus]|uniref:GNAT family N-acetyltransferase n=1 Tax=Mesobacillus subterraneus TaxID=285983 RepID=UPI00204136C4|nr:GNAT family N-acetyltransferase [Mesobacillus subterraneus]